MYPSGESDGQEYLKMVENITRLPIEEADRIAEDVREKAHQ